MKFLFFSKKGASLPMADRCAQEGHKVSFYCETKGVGSGFVNVITSPIYDADTVLVFDHHEYGKRADDCRRNGNPTIGASVFGYNLAVIPAYNESIASLMDTYVMPDNTYIEGWFNGDDWVMGLTSICVFDTRFLAGDMGPTTGFESGTMCYWKRLRPEMFKHTLGKLTTALRKVAYYGPISYARHLFTGFNVMNTHATPLANMDCAKLLSECARGALRKAAPKYDFITVVRVSQPPYPFHPTPCGFVFDFGSTATQSAANAVAKAAKFDRFEDKQYRIDAGERAANTIPKLLKEDAYLGRLAREKAESMGIRQVQQVS